MAVEALSKTLTSPREVISFARQQGDVWSVAVSPDGRRAATGAWRENNVRLWDIETGTELTPPLIGHGPASAKLPYGDVRSVAFSPDGRLILSGSFDGTARLWDVETRREVKQFRGHTGLVSSVSFSADGRLILTASYDKTLKIWDATTGRLVRTLQGHLGVPQSAVFTPDGRFVLSCEADGGGSEDVWVWSVETGNLVRRLAGHQAMITQVAVSPDGRHALSASRDRTVRVWRLPDPRSAGNKP